MNILIFCGVYLLIGLVIGILGGRFLAIDNIEAGIGFLFSLLAWPIVLVAGALYLVGWGAETIFNTTRIESLGKRIRGKS